MGDGVEDEIDVCDRMDVAGGAGVVTGMRAGVCVGSGFYAIWGIQVWVLKFGCSSLSVQVGVVCEFLVSILDGVSLPTTSR
jgi:hypothetical protein